MYQGLHSDLFMQAEIDYRHQRLMADFHPRHRPVRAHHHLPWPLHRDPVRHRRHQQPVVG